MVRLVGTLWLLVTLSFAVLHLIPGDPVRAALGTRATQELVDARRAELGLDLPLWDQYWRFISGLVSGDLGVSLTTQLPVADIVAQRFGYTVWLGLGAFALASTGALLIGSVMAMLTRTGRRRRTEAAFSAVTGFIGSVPEFLLGVGLVFVFAVTLGWLPVGGSTGPAAFVLPVFAMALGPMAALARIVRVEMRNALGSDYMRTVRAKHLPFALVYIRHVLPNMLTATLSISGMLLAAMITGSVLIERIFAWPGMGTAVVNAILAKDYPVVQVIVVVLGVMVLGANLLVDIALAALDPRSAIKDL